MGEVALSELIGLGSRSYSSNIFYLGFSFLKWCLVVFDFTPPVTICTCWFGLPLMGVAAFALT